MKNKPKACHGSTQRRLGAETEGLGYHGIQTGKQMSRSVKRKYTNSAEASLDPQRQPTFSMTPSLLAEVMRRPRYTSDVLSTPRLPRAFGLAQGPVYNRGN